MFFGIIAFEEYLYRSKTGESKTKKKKKKENEEGRKMSQDKSREL